MSRIEVQRGAGVKHRLSVERELGSLANSDKRTVPGRAPPRGRLGVLLVMAGVAAGFGCVLAIGFALNQRAAPDRGPVLDRNGFPVPIAGPADASETTVRPGETRLDIAARTLLPAGAFRVYAVIVLPLSVLALGYGLVRYSRPRRRRASPVERVSPPAVAAALLSPDKLRQTVEGLAQEIQAPADSLPTYGRRRDFGYPHIEVDQAYHWVVTERGQEIKRRTTDNLDELLYIIFQSVTFSMALNVESRNRRKGEDFRRQLFDVQLSLLSRLRPEWAARLRVELDERPPTRSSTRRAGRGTARRPAPSPGVDEPPPLAGPLARSHRFQAAHDPFAGFHRVDHRVDLQGLGHADRLSALVGAGDQAVEQGFLRLGVGLGLEFLAVA